jgi:hypothetical protein
LPTKITLLTDPAIVHTSPRTARRHPLRSL